MQKGNVKMEINSKHNTIEEASEDVVRKTLPKLLEPAKQTEALITIVKHMNMMCKRINTTESLANFSQLLRDCETFAKVNQLDNFQKICGEWRNFLNERNMEIGVTFPTNVAEDQSSDKTKVSSGKTMKVYDVSGRKK